MIVPNDSLKSASVLIVDDEEGNLRLLEAILRRAGYSNVTSTTDPRLAIPLYCEVKPDLVLLDLAMPHMDGFQVMEDLRRQVPDGAYVPILVLTADTSRESKRRALSAGANDFLTKPLDQEEVVLRIKNLLAARLLSVRLRDQHSALEEKVREGTGNLRQSLGLLERTAEEHQKLLDRLVAVPPEPVENGGAPKNHSSQPTPYPAIVLVEDDPGQTLLVQRVLSKAGLANPVRAFNDGEDALGYLSNGDRPTDASEDLLPALVLLDLHIPRKSGLEILAWIRGTPDFDRVPVIMLSGSTESEDIDRAFEFGAESYLVKPVAFDALVDAVTSLALPWAILRRPSEP